MKVVIALRTMENPGGLQTFLTTIADHLPALGHEVVVYTLFQGMMADFARRRGIRIVGDLGSLPEQTDATIACDKVLAVEMAVRYPRARRLFTMHSIDEFWLPPLEPGIVAATIAPNDRLATLARGCAGAGEVIRVRQPVDLYRFLPRGRARETPQSVLLLGNYGSFANVGADQLRAAWAAHGLEWSRCGHPNPTMEVAGDIAKADIVVGYGRSILEAMACARPAYVHEHSGSDGWVTEESYARLESDGFAGTALRAQPTQQQLSEDFARYDAVLGAVGHDLIRAHHDARFVTAGLMAAIAGFDPPTHRYDAEALASMRNLAVLLYRSTNMVQALREEMRARRLAYEKDVADLKALNAKQDMVIAQQRALILKNAPKAKAKPKKG